MSITGRFPAFPRVVYMQESVLNLPQSATKFESLLDILLEPRRCFGAIRQHPTWFALPLGLTLLLLTLLVYWYYSSVDAEWFIRYQLSLQPELTLDQASIMRKFLHPEGLIGSGILFGSLTIILTSALHAAYFHLLSKLTGETGFSYLDWFSFVVWVSFPGIFATLSIGIAYASAGTQQVDFNQLLVSSLNHLWFQVGPESAFYNLLNSLSLTTFWCLLLGGLGYRCWTGRSWNFSLLVSALPYVGFYLLWLLWIVGF